MIQQKIIINSEERGVIFNDNFFNVLPLIEANSIDLIISDLPYGMTQNKWDENIDLDKLFKEFIRITKPNSTIVLFGSNPFSAKLIMAGQKFFKYSMVWEKNKSSGHLNAKKMPLKAHEDIHIFSKGKTIYNPQKSIGHKPMNFAINKNRSSNYGVVKPTTNNAGTTERYPNSILKFPVVNNDSKERFHPTQKPIELLRYLIKTFSNENDKIIDVSMGSGSSIISGICEKRYSIGIELDDEYFKQAKKWITSYPYK